MMDDEYCTWGALSTEKTLEIISKLAFYEDKSWHQVRAQNPTNQHPVPVADLVKPARDRLEVLKLDDLDELVRFRLAGTERVWCVRFDNVMYLLWWDPNHEVCPSAKKNT